MFIETENTFLKDTSKQKCIVPHISSDVTLFQSLLKIYESKQMSKKKKGGGQKILKTNAS